MKRNLFSKFIVVFVAALMVVQYSTCEAMWYQKGGKSFSCKRTRKVRRCKRAKRRLQQKKSNKNAKFKERQFERLVCDSIESIERIKVATKKTQLPVEQSKKALTLVKEKLLVVLGKVNRFLETESIEVFLFEKVLKEVGRLMTFAIDNPGLVVPVVLIFLASYGGVKSESVDLPVVVEYSSYGWMESGKRPSWASFKKAFSGRISDLNEFVIKLELDSPAEIKEVWWGCVNVFLLADYYGSPWTAVFMDLVVCAVFAVVVPVLVLQCCLQCCGYRESTRRRLLDEILAARERAHDLVREAGEGDDNALLNLQQVDQDYATFPPARHGDGIINDDGNDSDASD